MPIKPSVPGVPYLGGRQNFFPDPHLAYMADRMRPYDPARPGDAALVGLPFDGGVVSHRRGARFGPQVIRELLCDCTSYNLDLDVDLSEFDLVDCGDVEVSITDFDETHRRVEAVLTTLFETGMPLLILGGDHSLTYPSITALSSSLPGRRIGVIDFDTHLDIRSDWEHNAGLWARQVQDLPGGVVRGRNVVQIGVHGFAYSRYYYQRALEMGMSLYRPADVRRMGIEGVMQQALEQAADGVDALYISVDIDVVDAPYAPGTNEAPHGGMQPWEVIAGVVQAAQHPLTRALDIMEIAPPLDLNGITANLGVELSMQFLSGLALRKTRRPPVEGTLCE